MKYSKKFIFSLHYKVHLKKLIYYWVLKSLLKKKILLIDHGWAIVVSGKLER